MKGKGLGNAMISSRLTTDGPPLLYFKHVDPWCQYASLIQTFHKHPGKKTFFIKLPSSHIPPLLSSSPATIVWLQAKGWCCPWGG